MKTGLAVLAGALFLSGMADAHTWVEQVMRIKDGKFVGPIGYPRDFQPRTTPNIDVIAQNKILTSGQQPIPDSQAICRPGQKTPNYSAQFPALRANPGDWVALTYLENGHSTLKTPERAINGGTVFIYGTTQPSEQDTVVQIHKVWNAAGTGGDGRGRLLATRNFDNGVCHEKNDKPESLARQASTKLDALPCQADVQLPGDLADGKYTLYWVWDWPQFNPQTDDVSLMTGSEPMSARVVTEMYTSCLDIDITRDSLPAEPAPLGRPDTMLNDADAAQLANIFQVTKDIGDLVNGAPAAAVPNPPPAASSPSDPAVVTPPPAADTQPPPADEVEVVTDIAVGDNLVFTITVPAPHAIYHTRTRESTTMPTPPMPVGAKFRRYR